MDFPEKLAKSSATDYSNWSNQDLIARVTELERKLESYTSSPRSSSTRFAPSTEPPQILDNANPASSETEADRKVPVTSTLGRVPTRSPSRSSSRPRKAQRVIDHSKYSMRFIALKFAYLGQEYNGFEHANGNITALPTIEEELFRALRKTRLIFPASLEGQSPASRRDEERRDRRKPYIIDWEGCEYSKCGRTDRGVSAFGQVIGIRVRSAKPKRAVGKMRTAILTPSSCTPGSVEASDGSIDDPFVALGVSKPGESDDEDDSWDDIADELPYITMLNQVLPADIRILAWCPHPPPGFDARFSCRERRYRYFFTQPAFSPTPGPMGLANSKTISGSREGWLDIDAMREGAKQFVGSHDFRNFCKLDTSKQITNFVRTISHADIEPAPEPFSYFTLPEFSRFESASGNSTTEIRRNEQPLQAYMFTLHGSAFLWHQVRHMVAILFLIGQGLESPSMVAELLDVEKNPRRPMYDMSSDAPLVLWDCVFPEKDGEDSDGLEWVYAGDERLLQTSSKKLTGKPAIAGIIDDVWTIWRRRKIDELLAANLLDLVAKEGNRSALSRGRPEGVRHSQKMFRGGNDTKQGGTYIPLMQRSKLETVEDMNARYMAGRGSRKDRMNGQKPESSADVNLEVDE